MSMLVLKKRLSGGGQSDWSQEGVKVMLPDQISLSNDVDDDDAVGVSFTKYNNLGHMLNDKEKSIRFVVLFKI